MGERIRERKETDSVIAELLFVSWNLLRKAYDLEHKSLEV